MDVVYLLLTAVFFAATALFITGCEALRGQS
jgi:hypothetical protein